MFSLLLAAALMADGAPAAAPAATTAPAPQMKINIPDLAGCTALTKVLAEAAGGQTEQAQALQAVAINWALAFDAAAAQTSANLRGPYEKALADYKTQLTNSASDEVLSGVMLEQMQVRLGECENLRAANAAFFSFVVDDYLEQAKARQAAAPAPQPAKP